MIFSLEIFLAACYIIMLINFGKSKKAKFASWHMFADIYRVEIDFVEVFGNKKKRFEPYEHLPHTHLSMSLGELIIFLNFLDEIKKIKINGSVTVFSGQTTKLYEVKNNHVLAR